MTQEEKGLAIIPSTILAIDEKRRHYIPINFDATPAGAEAMGETRIQLPQLKVLNPNSKFMSSGSIDAKFGLYHNTVTDEICEEIDLIPLHIRKARYFHTPGSLTDLACLSLDGYGKIGTPVKDPTQFGIPVYPTIIPTADGKQEEVMMGRCQTCPKAQFTPGANGKNIKPACRETTWLYAMYPSLLEDIGDAINAMQSEDELYKILSSLIMIPFNPGKATATLEKITNAASFSGVLYSNVWTFKSEQIAGPAGPYWIPVATGKKDSKLTDDQRVIANSLRLLCLKLNPSIKAGETLFDDESSTTSGKPDVRADSIID